MTGLVAGLSRQASTEFSFFLALPTMYAACLYTLFKARDHIVDELVAIVDRAGPPSAIAPRCRGWIGAPPVAQIAERAVLSASEDWSIDDVERVVSIAERGNGWVCDVQVGARSWEVVVESGRIVPTIRCRAEGGLPAKTGREYRVVSIRER